MVESVRIVFNTAFWYISLYPGIPYDCDSLLQTLTSILGFARVESIRHVEHVKPSYTAIFDILTRKTVSQQVGGVVSGLRYLKRCLQVLPTSLFPLFFARSLIHCSLARFFRSTESLAKARYKLYFNSLFLFSFYLFASCKISSPHINPTDCCFFFRIILRTIHCLVNNAVYCWTPCFPLWLPDLRFRREYSVSIKFLDQFRFMGNLPPTPPLTQHFVLSEK